MSSYQRFDNNNDSIEEPDDKEEIKENDTQDINFSHQSTETSTGLVLLNVFASSSDFQKKNHESLIRLLI